MKKVYEELKIDIGQAIKIPSTTTIMIMIIYPLLEIFIYLFVGNALPLKAALYAFLLTLIPFVLGYKISNKIFEYVEVVILLVLSFFIVFSGITLKSAIFSFDFPLFFYFISIIICIIWTLIDFSELSRLRQRRKEYKESMKTTNNVITDNQVDGMEV
ncbi:hypothetical protein [Fusibacter tunisiensis]|uniref:Ferric reductase n=1 Tax=Fusibacter tunisiensis TaxID=1008308 RepID=A0ABS2MTT9_9FIRM|nr:hypothetical protein [Fusibacter tunisiensis]MBM7562765.1 putative ferric reductase [Fusibacter tunisiensis]